jgi:hypothetical protein
MANAIASDDVSLVDNSDHRNRGTIELIVTDWSLLVKKLVSLAPQAPQ